MLISRFPILACWPIALILLVLFTLPKLFYIYTWDEPVAYQHILDALVIGMRFDIRWITISIGFLWIIIKLSRYILPNNLLRHLAALLGTVIFTIILFFVIFDLGYFTYTNDRLNAYILTLALEEEALLFVWQSYSVILIALLVMVVAAISYLFFYWWSSRYEYAILNKSSSWVWASSSFILLFSLFVILTFGRIAQYPLRWSDLVTQDNFTYKVGVNPIQNFVDTYKHRTFSYNKKKAIKAFPLMADYLKLPKVNREEMNFTRNITSTDQKQNYNVVIIVLESFAGFKSSVANNNPVDTSPFLNRLSKEGVLFTKMFTSQTGTARGIFALLTGLPDVVDVIPDSTASRNPLTIVKPMLPAVLPHDFYYFIGGSASWANIRGLINANTDNILYEEKDFNTGRVDVWGVSDADLFRETAKILSESKQPFFSVIQTAGNHRPYTIPDSEKDFEHKTFPPTLIEQAGFKSLKELEAYRFMDYSVELFFELMKKHRLIDNTIFVILGDHGIKGGKADNRIPPLWEKEYLTGLHTPLIFYGPKIFKPAQIDHIAGQVDVMPTIANLLGYPFESYALGRDLFDKSFDDDRKAFYYYTGESSGIIEKDLLYVETSTGQKILYDQSDRSGNSKVNNPELIENKSQLLDSYLQTAKYLLLQNKQAESLK